MIKKAKLFFILLCGICAALSAQEPNSSKNPLMIIIPLGYDFMRLEEQTLHSPSAGIGFLLGKENLPFTEVEQRFMGMALYKPFIFTETPEYSVEGEQASSDLPKLYHQIQAEFDGRIKRHQLLFSFQSSSNEPVIGGLHTFNIGGGWGYELIRQPHVSLILGALVAVSDFGITLPGGGVWPLLPLPFVRFGVDTQWFASSFDFLGDPSLTFTVAPKSKIRLTGDMRMKKFRSIDDLLCEFTLWYRFFDSGHKLGDFAGIGLGFKNGGKDFALSGSETEDFGFRQRSVFATLDLSILKIQGGWIFDSQYIVDNEKSGNPGKGFFISVGGMIPIGTR